MGAELHLNLAPMPWQGEEVKAAPVTLSQGEREFEVDGDC